MTEDGVTHARRAGCGARGTSTEPDAALSGDARRNGVSGTWGAATVERRIALRLAENAPNCLVEFLDRR